MPIPESQEEITTIFVVGFPEDMGEREFVNMFTFCTGFEAAILKIPSAITEAEEQLGYGKKQIVCSLSTLLIKDWICKV